MRLVAGPLLFQERAADCIAHCSNPAFDASTFEVWGALLNGASVLVVPQEVVLEPKRLVALLRRHQVSILWMTIGLFAQHADALAAIVPQLRYLMTGGDVVDPRVLRRALAQGQPENLICAYGPTECTTFASTYRMTEADAAAAGIPIGKPISNTQIYILDQHLRPVPIGASGEIYVGGAGVALKYLNRPELTASRFLKNPFSADPRERLYKTGDLGRWRVDGNIEFLGRNDYQVKLRGFRIELGEIESRLLQHPDVEEAVVLAREVLPGQKRLVAYIRGREGTGPQTEDLVIYLKSVLPEYMVPSGFVVLQSLPLTATGKVDRRALSAIDLERQGTEQYQAPQGEVEEMLAKMWQEILQVDAVGRNDNFFEIGGHSLLAMQLVVRVRAELSIEVPISMLFECPSVRELGAQIERLRQARFLEAVNAGGQGIEAMLEELIAMPEGQVEELLRKMGGRP